MKKSVPAKELLVVGGGILGDADGDRSPAGVLATWIERVRGGRPVVVALDMNGSAPLDTSTAMNPKRFAAMRGAGFADTGQRNAVAGPMNRTLDYVWIWSKVTY